MSFESSWNDAELIVYRRLLVATGSEDKRNAFRGFLPAMLNVWMLNTGGSRNNEHTLWTPNIVSIHTPAEIVGQFAERDDALQTAMRIVKALPIAGESNVQCFRIAQGGFPEIQPEVIPVGNESKKFLVHTFTIDCDLVFSTGGRIAT